MLTAFEGTRYVILLFVTFMFVIRDVDFFLKGCREHKLHQFRLYRSIGLSTYAISRTLPQHCYSALYSLNNPLT